MSGPTQSLAFAFGIGAITSAVASRLRVPAVLPLLLAGVLCGRSGLGLVDLDSVGAIFRSLVAVSIGLLVFEGSLHLDLKELGRAPRAVVGMLTIGALATLSVSAFVAQKTLGLDWPLALVLGSLVVVTGPTVVQPILRTVRLSSRLSSVLGAEAILIDPIGVICAVGALEVALAYYRDAFEGTWPNIVWGFGIPFAGGLGVGVACGVFGVLVFRVLGSRASPNVAAFGLSMLAFAVGESVTHEGGLVAAAVSGMILSNLQVVKTTDLRRFKEQIATILVGMLFVLLASAIDLESLRQVGRREFLAVAAILFIVRPVSVVFGTFGSRLDWKERLFVALFAPRGVAAVSLAALNVAELQRFFATDPLARYGALPEQTVVLNNVVILLVVASVVWATATSWPLAWLLGLLGGKPGGVAVVGAHALGRGVAKALRELGVPVVLIDSNTSRVVAAKASGIDTEHLDATDAGALGGCLRAREIGWVYAWTGNVDVDRVVARFGVAEFGEKAVSSEFPLIPGESMSAESAETPRPMLMRVLDSRVTLGLLAVKVIDAADFEPARHAVLFEVQGGRVTKIGELGAPDRHARLVVLVASFPADEPPPEAPA